MAKKTEKTANKGLLGLEVRNFRALANISLELGPLNVFFGPNGAGKSSLLDTLWFVHDCATRGVSEAAAFRNQGIGLLWDGATDGANIAVKLESETVEYEIKFGYAGGRLDNAIGEKLHDKGIDADLLVREVGAFQGKVLVLGGENYKDYQNLDFSHLTRGLLALTSSNRVAEFKAVSDVENLLNSIKFYFSRAADFRQIRKQGSQSTPDLMPSEDGQNILTVLRNLHARHVLDERYDTIIHFMRQAFPTFQDIFIEQTGLQWVYGSFIEKGLRNPVSLASVSDGHLQMLLHLTALFCHEKTESAIVMFDEPETSLHPYAIAIFAKAVKLAIKEWNKQVFIATHSPVLLSQFEQENIFAVGKKDGATFIQRVSEMSEIKDLLEEYALGSLYMAEAIAPQRAELVGVEG